jgi:hypothetical protein
MKSLWLVVLTLLACSLAYADGVLSLQKNHTGRDSRPENLIYHEDFENGAVGWTHTDGNIPLVNWHIYNAGGTQGNVWWMGNAALANDNNPGGYYNHQYLVLDTPALSITSVTPNLSFRLNYLTEAPGSSGNYNGWDGCNVRISTDNGASWTVISGSPAYNITADFAFGDIFDEGESVPAWGGNSGGWLDATFNLSTYIGQTVKIRFAFASDDAVCTQEQPELFGMMVDDIALGIYLNSGVDDNLMTISSEVPTGGDLWHLATVADAPSPTHVYRCSGEDDLYNINMLDYLYSPPISLPAGGEIRADFMFSGSFYDPSSLDCFGWEVSPDDGDTWYSMSNPYGAGFINYTYATPPLGWESMVQYYQEAVSGYLSSYAGMTVRFRWFFRSNENEPSGWGMMIDDFMVYHLFNVTPPTDLSAAVNGSSVILNWQIPGGGGTPGWLHYDDGTNFDSMGLTSGGTWDVAAKWDMNGLHGIAAYVGMTINQVRFYSPASTTIPTMTYTLKIFNGLSATEVYSQPIQQVIANSWTTVTLNTPYVIPAGTAIWIGLRFHQPSGAVYPIGLDPGPAIVRYSDLYRTGGEGGTWTSLTVMSAGAVSMSWNIQAYISDANGRAAMISPQNTLRDRDVSAYHVYRDAVQVAEIPPQSLSYTDQNVSTGLHTYTVTAQYDTLESIPGNPAQAFLLPGDYSSVGYHDNSAEQYTVPVWGNNVAVRFQRSFGTTLKCIRFFINSVGRLPVIVQIYDNNDTTGMPDLDMLGQIELPADELFYGWNYLQIPDSLDLSFDDGSYYVVLNIADPEASFGIDSSVNGHSLIETSPGEWSPLGIGELMLDCIVQNYFADSTDPIQPVLILSAANSPNPFNTSTRINYTLPKDGSALLSIYNIKGQLVRILVRADLKAGNHQLIWDGTDSRHQQVADGMYFCRLQSQGKYYIRKMLILR